MKFLMKVWMTVLQLAEGFFESLSLHCQSDL